MIEFLVPVSKYVLAHREILPPGTLGKQISVYAHPGELPELKEHTLAIFGIKENRNDEDYLGEEVSFDSYRKALYSLYPGNWNHSIIDLGDIEQGETPEDSHFAAREVISRLMQHKIIPLVLGAGQDLAYSQYRAYDTFGQMVNVANIDSRFDLGNAELPISNKSFIGKMVVDKPYHLFNYCVLGYQSFYNSPQEISLMEKLYFEAYRLGEISADITLAEPALRDADMVILDASAIKSSELSYKHSSSPNGLDGREVCALSRYAGISNRVSSFGIYEIGKHNSHDSGAMLIAQIVWYFIEGVNFRLDEGDFSDERLFTTYIVPVEETILTFKKSNKTERWWIEMPFISNVNNKLKRPALLPCTYGEYLGACNQEIPERWLKARHKNEL